MAGRFTACRSWSRTISTSRACRPPPPVPPSPITPARSALRRAAARRRGRDCDRQDQPRPVRDRPRRRALALWRSAQCAEGAISSRAGRARGSATAVGAGLVPFALGTDTAGSGRVPAALNGIVGLEAEPRARRRLPASSRRAARSTPSPFSPRDVADAFAAVHASHRDSTNTRLPVRSAARAFGVRRAGTPALGFPDRIAASSSAIARPRARVRARRCALAQRSAHAIVDFDFVPFAEVARLLYDGPWVAERYAATKPLIESQPRGAASGDPRHHRRRAQV